MGGKGKGKGLIERKKRKEEGKKRRRASCVLTKVNIILSILLYLLRHIIRAVNMLFEL